MNGCFLVMALSAWGKIPDDMDIDFSPMQTPDAKDIADITERKSNAILAVYQNDLVDAAGPAGTSGTG